MAKYCPLKDGPAIYLDCIECDDKVCEYDNKNCELNKDKDMLNSKSSRNKKQN